jgi:hypothetical protein
MEAAVTDDDAPTAAEACQAWSEIVAADMANASFRTLVDEIGADQERWTSE